MATDIDMETADFTNNPLADFGRTVSWEDCTKAIDPIHGDETLSYASGVNKTVIFFKRSKTYEQNTEGLVELGDAYIMATTTFGFAKDDRITVDSEVYLIRSVIRRYTNTATAFYDYCILFRTNSS